MKRNGYAGAWAAVLALAIVSMTAGEVAATPDVNGAVINERIFNDCPTSVLTTQNFFPGLISIDDQVLDCGGFANLHNWRFSDDGGATAAVFNNNDSFKASANLTISGTADGEAGLQISPWWSQDVDGRFNVRTTDGEIACFGGRLPFYSFTGDQGVTYVKGTTIRLTMTYLPNGLSEGSPATIEYELLYNNTLYTSGPLFFDEGNPAEGFGSWGMLDDARVGGHVQPFLQAGNPNAGLTAEWNDIKLIDYTVPISTDEATWGQIKATYR